MKSRVPRFVRLVVVTAALLTPLASLDATAAAANESAKLTPVTGRKIWDISRIADRPKSRMELTDLIRFKGHWYCGFHEGEIHGNHPSGRGRIIRSADGEKWESVALLQWDAGDVREPRLSITAEGHLMVNTSVFFVSKTPRADGNFYQLNRTSSGGEKPLVTPDGAAEPVVARQSVTWISTDGTNWSEAHACPTGVNTWRWDVTWYHGMGYSIGYSGKDAAGTLYRTRDGKNWRPLLEKVLPPGRGNEGSIAFGSDHTAYCLLRGDPGSAMLGIGKAPYYQEWTWKDPLVDWHNDGVLKPTKEVIRALGGPKIIRLSDGRFVGVGRASGISLFFVDPEKATFTRFASIAGTSYAGIAEHGGFIWVTYGDSSAAGIHLAKVKIPPAQSKVAGTAAGEVIKSAFTPPVEFAHQFGSYPSPLRFYDGTPVASAADWSKRRDEILRKWHGIMGEWPPLLRAPKLEIIAQTSRDNFAQHEVRIEIAAGIMERAYLLIPPGKGPFPAVVVPYYEPATSIGLKGELRDFAYQLARRGFVTLAIGSPGGDALKRQPDWPKIQTLSFLAYVAANCHTVLTNHPAVDPQRIGIVGHSYGGKWAMFASCLYDKYACGAWSDGGIVFDEKRGNVNYWADWYLGWMPGLTRPKGGIDAQNPATGAYRELREQGHDLTELHALMAPRPFLVSGGSEDPPERWRALNHAVQVNHLLGFADRVGMTNRKAHAPTEESNAAIYAFFERVLALPPRR